MSLPGQRRHDLAASCHRFWSLHRRLDGMTFSQRHPGRVCATCVPKTITRKYFMKRLLLTTALLATAFVSNAAIADDRDHDRRDDRQADDRRFRRLAVQY